MIYLDAAATTLQKPDAVRRAMIRALDSCANPGRSGHRPAMRAAETVFDCRCAAAEFFGVEQPERVIFTHNATHALNIALRSLLRRGGHAVISGYEHNSVVRPLEDLAEQGVTYTVAQMPLFCPETVCAAVEQAIRPDTCCVVLNHVSNVFGYRLPLEEVDALCARKGLYLVVDASQSAGILPLKVSSLAAAAFVCMPGHKGLYGPTGTGILLCCKDVQPYSDRAEPVVFRWKPDSRSCCRTAWRAEPSMSSALPACGRACGLSVGIGLSSVKGKRRWCRALRRDLPA